MRNIDTIELEIDELVSELMDIAAMTDDEVCERCNVNSRKEAVTLREELIEDLSKELGEAYESAGYYEDAPDEAEEIFGSHLAMDEYLY